MQIEHIKILLKQLGMKTRIFNNTIRVMPNTEYNMFVYDIGDIDEISVIIHYHFTMFYKSYKRIPTDYEMFSLNIMAINDFENGTRSHIKSIDTIKFEDNS